ncbi:hypothetical protein GYMLUDRAFT_63114 [Collybiopsis luxurians FD-317 M1]|uniref:Uncharacterized protein n=1 Tax=Collybiopsis luxurians FD-317 M1 TaxID=944289 RepID=A0A0D0BIC9_9AGAR|nr:hypothetical protein GYMLUDRAFT_63114 [Collybiopsis luxurians FD-317 M1]
MVVNRPVPHLAQGNAPPPPMMVLLAHRDLPKPRLGQLLAHSDLTSPQRSRRRTSERMHPYIRRSYSSRQYRRATSSPLSTSSESSSDELPQPGPSLISHLNLVRKPKNASHSTLDEIRASMGWTQEKFDELKAIQNRLTEYADKHLDPVAHRFQKETKMKVVKEMLQIVKDFPALNNFHNLWPIDILLMGILKRQKEKSGCKSSRIDGECGARPSRNGDKGRNSMENRDTAASSTRIIVQ